MNTRAALLVLCAGTIAIAVGACSGSGGSGPPPTPSLVSGTYIYSGSSLAVDSCGLGAATGFNDFEQGLAVDGESVVFNLSNGGDPVVISGSSSFTATLTSGVDFAVPTPLLSTIDWTTTALQLASGLPLQLSTGYHCIESVSYQISGTITGKNTFSRRTALVHSIVSGSAATCAGVEGSEFEAVIPSFPCTATLDQDAALAP